ncbi:MAG: sodium:solute symporter family transporter, partial [Planctomycetota bacterium]
AVIWTDVLQVVVLLGGAILCIALIPFHVPGGWNGMNAIAEEAGKLRLLDFRWDLAKMTFWTILLGGFAGNLISYGSDQTVIQRYLTTRDEQAAARSIWTNALMCIPGSLLFFGMGTALFVFYKTNPAALNPTLPQADAIFPFYIVTRLPAAVAGVLIAGVFAAAMSSLDSSMNSVATAFTTDFYRRFKPEASDHRCLALARGVTVVAGLLGTAFALTMAQWQVKSVWDQFATVLGLFGGGLGGLFLLAIFTRRAHGVGAIIGLLGSAAVQYLIQTTVSLDPRFLAVTGMGSCFVIAYVTSLLIPAGRKPLDGLTCHTLSTAD